MFFYSSDKKLCFQDEIFYCKVRILGIDEKYGWWYKACPACKKKMNMYGEKTYWCERCKIETDFVPMYKVEVTATDETETATFLLFGSSAEKLLRLPSEKIKSPSFTSTNNVPAYILKHVINIDKVFGVSPTTRNIPGVGESLIFKVKHITDINEGDSTQQSLSITTQIDALYSQETPQSKKHIVLTLASTVISPLLYKESQDMFESPTLFSEKYEKKCTSLGIKRKLILDNVDDAPLQTTHVPRFIVDVANG
ncbi:replication protein A 70 kDa DNA-binding subunit B-like [Canna indica]|uniref:Replication protein A 70 kDa DNA-binding subunit B-like n=1 Tax=Canna indica TaxID=4628 RepID=A0AAQ3KRB0_9LILI|nr:replication protein A 70 kDa DNA-binding subunit B-like [Canna indica]